ncbi:MAG: citrate/2-methylcitrate synthase, partial [Actinomycetota bacterium]
MTDTTATDLPIFRSEIAKHDLHNIWLRGENLADDVMGEHSFTDVVFLMLMQRYPDDSERRLLDAILVSLVEHGLTPSALVARVTYGVEPDSIQGAVAAGLLGVGGLVLGSMEECGRLLERIAEEVAAGDTIAVSAQRIAEEYRAEHRKLP